MVHRRGRGLQLATLQELHLVDQEDPSSVVAASDLAELDEERRQIPLEVPARRVRDGLRVETELEPAVVGDAGLESLQQTAEGPQLVADRLSSIEPDQRLYACSASSARKSVYLEI